jgi:uncharacterized repeat protein (TIGR03803 family)
LRHDGEKEHPMPRKNFLTDHVFPGTLSVAVITVMMFVMIATGWSQKRVPPTAREAAASPEWASKLAHPSSQTHTKAEALADRRTRQTLPQGYNGVIYDNGPVNGTVDAWTINNGYVVGNSFTLGASTTVGGFDFYVWAYPGDTPLTVDWSISSEPLGGGTVYGSGTVSVTDAFISSNQYGYDIDLATVTGLNVSLGAGTYFLNLQNATTSFGDPLFWDENSGPSQAYTNSVGSIPSEAFDVTSGEPTLTCFKPQGNLKVIHDFTGKGDGGGPGSLAIDKAGNLYGTTVYGGDNGFGLGYQVSSKGQGWVFTSLYSFTGGYNGERPANLIVGPDGSLYGNADGGLQNCGPNGDQCLVFRLRPQPNACRTSLCSWAENVVHRFTGDNGFNLVTASDQAGNLYGIFGNGGAQGAGAVFELTPSGGGWTENILYTFTAGSDGGYPSSLLLGTDGNLYGTTYAGGSECGGQGCGVVFKLTPSGSGWTYSVLYRLQDSDGEFPYNLVQDGSGNLYGIEGSFAIFKLSPSNGNWTYTVLWGTDRHYDWQTPLSMTIDAEGNLLGTGTSYSGCGGSDCDGTISGFGYVVLVDRTGFWQYLLQLNLQWFGSGGMAVHESGDGRHLYGTTGDCGIYGRGTVWDLTY